MGNSVVAPIDASAWSCSVAPHRLARLGRITLTVPAINAATEVVFLVTGAGKSAMLREVLHGPDTPAERLRLPARLVRPVDGVLRFCVDRAAAE